MRRMICNIAMTLLSLLGAGAMLFALVLTVDAQLWGYAFVSFVGLASFLALLIMSLADLAESELGHG